MVIMPIGAYNPWVRFHCTPEQAWRMSQEARAELFFPVHHSTFQFSREPVTEPLERLHAAAGPRKTASSFTRSGKSSSYPDPSMSLISLQNISKTFGVRTLFQNLSIVVSEGERIGLIGPNGSGKSTLVSILAGVEKADDGIVALRKNVRVSATFRRSRGSNPARRSAPCSMMRFCTEDAR